MYPLTTTIQYLRRKHNERDFGRMGEWNQHRREDGDEPEIRRRYNTAAGTKEDLIELVERVRGAIEKTGLYLNVGKTKVITTGDIGEVTVDGKDIEVVTKFVFLGALITNDGLYEKEVRRRIAKEKNRNGRTNINMEGQRSNDGDESETSERFGVPDCSLRSGDLDNEKT